MKLIREILYIRKQGGEKGEEPNPLPESMSEVITNKDYIDQYSFHFTQRLSEYASSRLKWTGSASQYIYYNSLEDLVATNGITLPSHVTMPDFHYLVNKLRSEHTTQTLPNDLAVIKFAVEYLNNPNYLEGEIFLEWAEHMYRLKKNILWDKFME